MVDAERVTRILSQVRRDMVTQRFDGAEVIEHLGRLSDIEEFVEDVAARIEEDASSRYALA